MVDLVGQPQNAVEAMKYKIILENLQRKKKRLAIKKRLRSQFDLKKNPKIYLMCDVSSCAWLLRQLDPNRTILVIDEPPMGSDSEPAAPEENPLACAMIQSMLTSTYKTIWMSATLPRVEALPTLVNHFMSRYNIPADKRSEHVRECFSTELDRGALMCGPTGAVAFPHQKVKSAVELQKLCERLPGDPLVLKAYTERALASLLERWALLRKEGKLPADFDKKIPPPEAKFADLSELNHAAIRGYAMELLANVAAMGNDQLVVDFCERRAASEGDKNFFPAFSLGEILFSNAYAYPGLTLVAHDDPAGQLLVMAERLMSNMPTAASLEADLQAQEVSAAKEDKFKDDAELERAEQSRAIQLKFSADLVIQSHEFLKKWCKVPAGCHVEPRHPPTGAEFKVIKELPVEERWQMLALAGAGAFDPKLNADPGNPVYTQWVHDQMTLKKLACVTAGKEFTWGANVPASTVVVTKAFGESTSVAGMLQYVGRAARRGLTTHGQAVFEQEEDLDRIFASPDGLSTEAKTMERFAKWWLSKGAEW
jgi:replicative superfamily II helicase